MRADIRPSAADAAFGEVERVRKVDTRYLSAAVGISVQHGRTMSHIS